MCIQIVSNHIMCKKEKTGKVERTDRQNDMPRAKRNKLLFFKYFTICIIGTIFSVVKKEKLDMGGNIKKKPKNLSGLRVETAAKRQLRKPFCSSLRFCASPRDLLLLLLLEQLNSYYIIVFTKILFEDDKASVLRN